jgi:colicin import membrane protein
MSLRSVWQNEGRAGTGINKMLVISFLIHTLFISALLFSSSLPSKKITFGPVYDVNLVSLPSSAMKPASAISNEINSAPKAQPITLKKQETSVIRKEDRSQIQRAIDDVRNRVNSNPGPQAKAPASSSASNAVSSSQMNAYYALIWSRIKSQWALPRGIMQSDNLEAIIDVKILRDGTVSRLEIEKSSGNRYFDQSAVKAVKKASPFPALPAWIQETTAEFGIKFHSSEGR